MKVVALQTWANGSLTMEEKQVADIPDDLAAYLIERGIVAESPEYYGGGSGGGVLVVTNTEGTLDKTWQEIHDAFPNVYIAEDRTMYTILSIFEDSGEYGVIMSDGGSATAIFVAPSASGYPAVQ